MNEEEAVWTRRAIDILAARPAGPRACGLATVDDEPDEASSLAAGFINLSTLLLTELEQLTGEDSPTILRDLAQFVLRIPDCGIPETASATVTTT